MTGHKDGVSLSRPASEMELLFVVGLCLFEHVEVFLRGKDRDNMETDKNSWDTDDTDAIQHGFSRIRKRDPWLTVKIRVIRVL